LYPPTIVILLTFYSAAAGFFLSLKNNFLKNGYNINKIENLTENILEIKLNNNKITKIENLNIKLLGLFL